MQGFYPLARLSEHAVFVRAFGGDFLQHVPVLDHPAGRVEDDYIPGLCRLEPDVDDARAQVQRPARIEASMRN